MRVAAAHAFDFGGYRGAGGGLGLSLYAARRCRRGAVKKDHRPRGELPSSHHSSNPRAAMFLLQKQMAAAICDAEFGTATCRQLERR